jgi:hypothetical protein
MSDYKFELDAVEEVPVVAVLKKLPISPEKKKWIKSLLLEDAALKPEELPDLKQCFQELIKQIDELDPSAFKPLFLFDLDNFYTNYSECFDESKFLSEQKKTLPDLFTKREDGKPALFKPYVIHILDHLHYFARKDKAFFEAYRLKKQEIRSSSSFEERSVYYFQLVFPKLPKRTYEANEEPLTPEEINSFLDFSDKDYYKATTYSVRLVAELEEILENKPYISSYPPLTVSFSIRAFPFILYGKEVYNRIYKTFSSEIECSSDTITQLDIPRWDEKNYIHEVFIWLALTLKRVSKDMSISILNRIFEEVNISNIIRIFSEFIIGGYPSIYGALLKEKNFEHINPVRNKLEYLDWALTTDTKNPHEMDLNKCRLFLDYIEYLSLSKPENKQAFVPFIRDKSIKDVLDFAARERVFGEFTFCERKYITDDWYDNFVDIIDEESSANSSKSFSSIEDYKKIILPVKNEKDKLACFRQLCKTFARKSPEDALSVAKLWFSEFHNHLILYSSREAFFNFAENEHFFYTKVFRCFINDEDFVCRFWSIPQEVFQGRRLSRAGQFWFIYYLACWIGQNNIQTTNVFDAASLELENKEVIFSDKISRFILSNQIFEEFFNEGIYSSHSLSLNNLNKDAKLFLYNLLAVFGRVPYGSILKNPHEAEEHFPPYLIGYRYSHDDFVPQEFLDFLFTIQNQNAVKSEHETYPLELIQEACKKKALTKRIVIEKVTKYIVEHRNTLIESDKIRGLILYFFVETREDCVYDAQTTLLMQLCERAIHESENSYMELSIFLRFRSHLHEKAGSILDKKTEILDILITRCSKMLNVYKKFVGKNEFPVDENTFYYDYVVPASDFILEKTKNIWKALKPLLLAFRASKERMLSESLHEISPLSRRIILFFRIDDKESLIELRYAMANDFTEYLKEAKKERAKENFTEREINEPGFDLSYTEPSSFWRYAYIRALADLRVKTDGRGHFFHNLLAKVSEEDPSEEVRTAAEKVMKELDSIRNGYSGNNHKKCLFEAFWWLRQAHMLSLGEKVDRKSANELRIKEWR